jgi:hypothetical protein
MDDTALKEFVQDLATLEVTTRVGRATVTKKNNVFEVTTDPDEGERVFYTRIDLVDADIFTNVPPEFAGDDALLKIHDANVALANKMIETRVRFMVDVAKAVSKEIGGLFRVLKPKT